MNYVPPIKDKNQIEQMKAALLSQSYRNYVIFTLAINYGRRISDILEMRVSDVRGREYFSVREDKTGKKIPIKVNKEVTEMLEKYCQDMADDEWLFPSKKRSAEYPADSMGHTPISRIQVWRDLKEAASECGIDYIGTHSLRKTFGYWLYKSTNDIALVQKIFGHRTQLDTLRYIGMEQEYIDNATASLVL